MIGFRVTEYRHLYLIEKRFYFSKNGHDGYGAEHAFEKEEPSTMYAAIGQRLGDMLAELNFEARHRDAVKLRAPWDKNETLPDPL